ncbi:hypothetical protein [Arthrobacter sp. UYCo732]|uniref:hypothetical protein n=1 Tax=Arthrobacter sp. UYCo732 TaxID=3156336 RepID=UPI0033914223
MSAENTTRQPKGVPVGGQFAATAHAEPDLTLTPAQTPPQPIGEVLKERYAAAKEQHDAYAQNEWVSAVREEYPDAAYAYVDVASDAGGSYTLGMGLYKADGTEIDLDEENGVLFENGYDAHWDMGPHQDLPDKTLFTPRSGVFTLDSIADRWAGMQSSPEPSSDPFAHLTGMDRARAQNAYAQQINTEAVDAYVEDLSARLLAINPDFAKVYVNRKADVESGLTFTLNRVEDVHGNYGDVNLFAMEDYGFQDIHLDRHVEHREDTDELYIDIRAN